jgi:RimJ/RimL family protein N-acetyltransferase
MIRGERDTYTALDHNELLKDAKKEKTEFKKTISAECVNSDEDAGFVAEVIIRERELHPEFGIPDKPKEDWEKMAKANKDDFFVIRTLDGNRIGFTNIFTKKTKNMSGENVTVYKSEISILAEGDKRRGYGTEAMFELLDKVFEDHPDLENIFATIVETNEASLKLHKSLGFSESDIMFTPDIVREGSIKLAISREEWKEQREEVVKKLKSRES